MNQPNKELLQRVNGQETTKILVDPTEIQTQYQVTPSNECVLFAVHATKTRNLVNTLLKGYLASSQDENLFQAVTHRSLLGYSDNESKNEDISFSVGFAERVYATDEFRKLIRPWEGGIAIIFPFTKLREKSTLQIKTGFFSTSKALPVLRERNLMETSFQAYAELSSAELWEMRHKPSNLDDFANLVHIDRKAGLLSFGSAEVGIFPDSNGLPRINLHESLILLPLSRKPEIIRYLQISLKSLNSDTNVEDLLAEYPEIYWYPQNNVDLAVKALSVANAN